MLSKWQGDVWGVWLIFGIFRNFKLLSFGAEAEEDEEESTKVNEQFSGKGKSSHDVLGVIIRFFVVSLFKSIY